MPPAPLGWYFIKYHKTNLEKWVILSIGNGGWGGEGLIIGNELCAYFLLYSDGIFRFRVKSESNDNVSYIVKIIKKGILSRKSKNDVYKNFLYRCECPAKKVVIFKYILYIMGDINLYRFFSMVMLQFFYEFIDGVRGGRGLDILEYYNLYLVQSEFVLQAYCICSALVLQKIVLDIVIVYNLV